MADKFQIERILADYNLGEIICINDQSHGYANQNFSVECCRKKVFVRFCIQQSLEDIEQEILLMSVLKENCYPTAYPLAREDGEYLSFSNKVPVVVYEFLNGDLPDLNIGVTSEIALAVAKLSMIDYPATLKKKNAISVEDSREILSSEAFISSSYTDVTSNFKQLFEELEDKLLIELPTGIIHGDVFPDNTLFKDNKLVGLVDFEEFAIDHLLFDVGMTVNGFCFDGINMHMNLLEVFIGKYNSVRKFTDKELDLIVDYMIWGAVGMTSWHLHQLLYKRNKVQLKRVRTLLERARLINLERSSLEKLLSRVLSQT